MRVTLIRTDCDDKPICPSVYVSDRGTTIVQGWLVGPGTVEVPARLLEGLGDLGGQSTERGTVLVRGAAVTDTEALAQMVIPDGEAAVELPMGRGGEASCSVSAN